MDASIIEPASAARAITQIFVQICLIENHQFAQYRNGVSILLRKTHTPNRNNIDLSRTVQELFEHLIHCEDKNQISK